MINIRTLLPALFLMVVGCSSASREVQELTAALGDETVDCGQPQIEDCAASLDCLRPALDSRCETTAHTLYVDYSSEGGETRSDWFFLRSESGECELHIVTDNLSTMYYSPLGSSSYVTCPVFDIHPDDTALCRTVGSPDWDSCQTVFNH